VNLKITRRRIAMVALPALLAGGATTAFAAAGDSNVIHACAGAHGALRLAAKCKPNEKAVAWSVTGPAGAQGPAGPAGAQGPAGPAGAAADPASVVGGKVLQGGDADIFAKIDGIAGESTDPQHAGEVDVLAFGTKVTNAGAGSAGGGGGGSKPQFDAITFSKLYDAASPKLFQRVATAQHIPSVTFTFRRPGANGATFLTYKLSDVLVSSDEVGGEDEKPGLERVELTFAKVEISYQPAGGGAPVTAGFDVKTNTSA
jgi:type VI secretion system secreted protein Hcp